VRLPKPPVHYRLHPERRQAVGAANGLGGIVQNWDHDAMFAHSFRRLIAILPSDRHSAIHRTAEIRQQPEQPLLRLYSILLLRQAVVDSSSNGASM
jgi:hypothetical protein